MVNAALPKRHVLVSQALTSAITCTTQSTNSKCLWSQLVVPIEFNLHSQQKMVCHPLLYGI